MNGDEVRILTVHPGALGDCILFGHLLKRLDGEVTLLTGSERGKLLTGMEVIDRAVDFDSAPMHELFSDVPLDACHLPRLLGRYDRLISCFGGGDRRGEQRLAAMCGAKSAAFLPVRPPPGAQGHLLEIWSELLGLDPPGLLRSDPWVVWRAWHSRRVRIRRPPPRCRFTDKVLPVGEVPRPGGPHRDGTGPLCDRTGGGGPLVFRRYRTDLRKVPRSD